MKKNISINIGGIIFHIEEDGYDNLKNYLDSVNAYFSSYEDNKEILGDIESRIAEIFLSKLNDGKQIITQEDVNNLITTMGTTKDFEISLENESANSTEDNGASEGGTSANQEEKTAASDSNIKRLYRDSKRKIIGGVAAGIANYFKIDPMWIRVIMLAFLFNIFFWQFSGVTFIAYFILWMVIPESNKLEEDKKSKKLFRSSEDRVLGGVAGGIASYFRLDPVLIRVIFIVSIFLGGAGVLVYLILWVITPEAKSITEKMQMQGEPLTLSNIEQNVKKSLNIKEGEENIFVKILLFPFRLLALVFSSLNKILRPLLGFLAKALLLIFGIVLVALGFALMVAFTISLFVLLGVGSMVESWVHFGEFPIEEFFGSLGVIVTISIYLVAIIPATTVFLLGLVVILKKKIVGVLVVWALFSLWLLGIIGLAICFPAIIRDYSVEDTHREEVFFNVTKGTAMLKLNEVDWNLYNSVDLKIRGYEDTTRFLLEMEFDSRGYSHTNAKANGEAVDYVVSQEGNSIYFDSEITFNEASFRFQDVSATFYIPYGKTFQMDYELRKILKNTLWIHGYGSKDLGDNTWVYSKKNGLECLTCEENQTRYHRKKYHHSERYGLDTRTYQFKNFEEVILTSFFDFEIVKGDDYVIRLEGDDDELDEVYLKQTNEELKVRYKKNGNWWKNRKERGDIKIFIEMPTLKYLKATGACEGEVRNFDNNKMLFDLSGASNVWASITNKDMKVDLSGASELTLVGRGKDFEATLSGASELHAFDFEMDDADIHVKGASNAKIYANNVLEVDASGTSEVRYQGDAQISIKSSGLSSVKRD